MTPNSKVRIALTPGEPAGIGPDLCIKLAQQPLDFSLVLFADPEMLIQRARALGLTFRYKLWDKDTETSAGIFVAPVEVAKAVIPGHLDKENTRYVLQTLESATKACLSGELDALVTGPVHKGIINDAGFSFSGHTEFLAQMAGVDRVVMMLMTEGLKVALVTTHIPLVQVGKKLNRGDLMSVIRIVDKALCDQFDIDRPRIAVCGLNPHAGEGGHLGTEENEIIEPVISELRREGIQLHGPVSADSAFTQDALSETDVVLAMYHDQGLPVLKHMGFGKAVNLTLGLPFIRTSVDHGTALDLAGTGNVDTGSLQYALDVASQLVTS